MLLAVPLAPLSAVDDGLPAALWVVLARGGALLALALAGRLAARLTGGPPALR